MTKTLIAKCEGTHEFQTQNCNNRMFQFFWFSKKTWHQIDHGINVGMVYARDKTTSTVQKNKLKYADMLIAKNEYTNYTF